MGFDLFIYLKCMMCPQKGKPYYYGPNLEKIYELPDFTIPEALRPYLQGRGHQFHAYLQGLNIDDQTEVDLDTFLECYPSWEDVEAHNSYEETMGWEKEDHEQFKALLESLHFLQCPFSVSWSY
jgi:hypothetical protein